MLPFGQEPGRDSEDSQRSKALGHNSLGCFSAKKQQSFIQMNPVINKINGRIYKHIIVCDVR